MTHSAAETPTTIIYLLAGIAALGSLGTHLLVPVLPMLAVDLGVSTGQAQRLIAIYLVGLACGQLTVGPLFDRRDRKSVLLGGLTCFCVASICAALAGSYGFLVVARFFQALGAAVGIVGARVLVNELYPPDEAVRRQSTLMAFILISPAIGPVIGGTIGEIGGWRLTLSLLSVMAVCSLLAAAALLPVPPRGAVAASTGSLLGDFAQLARTARFLSAALAMAGGSACLYMFLSAAPFLLVREFGLGARSVGLVLMIVAGSSIAGTFFVSRVDRGGKGLLAGTILIILAPVVLVAGLHSLPAFLASMCLLGVGAGFGGPAGVARILRSHPSLRGTSIAVSGAFQMAFSATCAAGLSYLPTLTATSLGLALMVPATIGFSAALIESRM